MKYLLLLSACVLFTACGNFTGLGEETCSENCDSSNNNNSQSQKIEDLNATVTGGVHDGTQVIHFNKDNQELTLTLPLTGGGLFEEFQENLPQIQGARLAFRQPDSGVALLELKVSLETLQSETSSLDETDELPNGSPIPGFKDKMHGYVDMDVLGTFVRIYISQGHLGIYMVSAFDPYVQVSYPLLNSDNQVLGYLSQIPSQAHFDGAFFVSLSLSENLF